MQMVWILQPDLFCLLWLVKREEKKKKKKEKKRDDEDEELLWREVEL